jgi:phosphoglycolate phosphatase
MSYKLIVFDLDGTLADTRQDLANAVNRALLQLSRNELSIELIGSFVGDGLRKLMERSLAATGGIKDQLPSAVEAFQSHYQDHLLDTTTVYPGVSEGLKAFKDQEMVVLTNKPRRYSLPIIEHLCIAGHFKEVYGGDSFPVKKPDPFPLQEIMKRHQVEKNQTLMIGDSLIDINAARSAGVLVCAVSYGFTSREKLAAVHPDFLVLDIRQIAEIVNKAS